MVYMILVIAVIIVIILFSMVLHELAHGYVAYKLGDTTAKHSGRLTLNPVSHIDPILTIGLPVILALLGLPIFGGAKPVPVNSNVLRYGEWGMALVAIAGPMVNFVLAFVAFVALQLTGISIAIDFGNLASLGFIELFLKLALYVNLGFFAFNILPIPPLDGSRVLYAIVPDFLRRIMDVVEQFGLIIVMLFVFVLGDQLGVVMYSIMIFVIQLFYTATSILL